MSNRESYLYSFFVALLLLLGVVIGGVILLGIVAMFVV